jgi:predicted transcriptional regulator
MDILNSVKQNLKQSNLAELRICADESGVPYNTLIRIKYNDVNPRIETIQPIFNYFKNKQNA